LTRWLCDTYGIPCDRTHILGHSEAHPATTHTGCPNAVWDWDYFMGMVVSGTCDPRTQTQSLATGDTDVILRPPPPDVLRTQAMGSGASEIASKIAGAAMDIVFNHDGRITWDLEQLRGLKHPNDRAPANPPAFRDAPTIRLEGWPVVEALSGDEISAWFSVDFQSNGLSLGNVRISNVGTNNALLRDLHVTAEIMDDNIVYPPERPVYAALRIRFHYLFKRPLLSDSIAITDLHLFADGTHEETSRWEQS
jgi:hypothetical protein